MIAALNARTELLCAGRGECSTVAVLGSATASGEPIGIQTWDWHEELSDSWLHWTIEHPSGHRVETMTEAGQVGKIGVSSAGIALLVNILGHRDDGPPIGVPIHVLNRAVLDNASGSVEALAMLAGAQMSASSAVTLVADDEDGGAICTAELSPAGPGFLTPDERGVLVHTNHFVADPGRSGDTMVIDGPDSVLRLDHARRAMARQREGEIDQDSILDAMRSHRGGAGAICCHPAAGRRLRRPLADAGDGGGRAGRTADVAAPRRPLRACRRDSPAWTGVGLVMAEKKPKPTPKKPSFTAEERAAMRERARELKAEAAGVAGEKDVLAKIAEMPPQRPQDRQAAAPAGEGGGARPRRRAPGTACPPTPATARSSASSRARTASRRATRRSGSATGPGSTRAPCGRPPTR